MLTSDLDDVRRTPFSPADLARLLARAGVIPHPFKARQQIHIGSDPGQLAIVLKGAVSVAVQLDDGFSIEAALAGAGDWLGWPPTAAHGQFTAALDGELGIVSLDALLAQASAVGRPAPDVLALAAPLVQRVSLNLACQARHSVAQRLARRILDLSRLGGDLSTVPMTQDDAAMALGVQRTSVTHAAVRLQQAQAVRVVRARTIIKDRALLERLACTCSRPRAPAADPRHLQVSRLPSVK
ncbi:Crp/Fnr family transcriptional regulator [Caulobacter segnis]|uniref:Crp/Fnr family transcriptional regulator n=1 Tax=Caulobacter segnis TaxID=88688 RepID=UPI00240F0FD7|nr:Crp/Fnr family transcriptional regulator [Caulobacter segnis]MDG2520357.1 Crp/Fnr family transcriptional regulator [Caulobacter segnis]